MFQMLGGSETDWNMNLAFLQQLDRRREDKAQSAIDGNLGEWWSCLWEIFDSITGLCSKEENDKTKDQLIRVLDSLSSDYNRGHLSQEHEKVHTIQRYKDSAQDMREIGLRITMLLYKYEVIYLKPPKKTNKEILKGGTKNK